MFVVAYRIFSWGMWNLSWGVWDLGSLPGIELYPPHWESLSHGTTREVPAVNLFNFDYCSRSVVYLIVVLICISFVDNDVYHHYKVLFHIFLMFLLDYLTLLLGRSFHVF